MDSLLALFKKEEQDEDFDIYELTRSLDATGWKDLLNQAFTVLDSNEHQVDWRRATTVIYWAVSLDTALPVPSEQCVARLYRCLEIYPGFGGVGLDDAENLVWSIVIKLKNISYDSSWSAYEDTSIRTLLEQMRLGV